MDMDCDPIPIEEIGSIIYVKYSTGWAMNIVKYDGLVEALMHYSDWERCLT
jgi:hypothetical protein